MVMLWMAMGPPVYAVVSPPSLQAKPTTMPDGGPVSAMATPHVAELAGQTLPDEGPRQEEVSQGIEELAWHEGHAAYRKGAWSEAGRFFDKIVTEHPNSRLVPSAQAFLAELSLRNDLSGQNRTRVIQTYKKLLQDYPQSRNAGRAEWRIADLYLDQGWFQEAQAHYERALAHAHPLPFDGHRAMLGLGYTLLAQRKWSNAEHAFATVRKQSDHEALLQQATVGQAHALFQQGRMADAQGLYVQGYRRWPKQFRLNPVALQRYALTQTDLHQEASAQELMLLYYNLYPRRDFSATALLHAADSMVKRAQYSHAEWLYGLTASLYRDTAQSTVAQMRAGALRADRLQPAGQNVVSLTLSAMLHEVPVPDHNDRTYRAMLQTVATQYVEDSIGTEARVYLGRSYEQSADINQALTIYKEATLRSGRPNDPWPLKATERLSVVLKPWMEAAVKSHDDFTLVSLFHRHGPVADQLYAQSPLLFEIAEAHRRLGFSPDAVRIYQQLIKGSKNDGFLEPILVGLGKTYLDQQDAQSARKVLERYRFQFPTGRYDFDVLELLVRAMAQQQDLQGLLHLCRHWLMHHPQHPERSRMYLYLATTLGELEQYGEAAIAYEEGFKAGAVQSPDRLLAYADLLSRLNRHDQAIAAYQAVLEKKPTRHQVEWAHLQTARHWNQLKQYDRATIALAELGETEDHVINRFSTAFKGSLQAARRPSTGEGL
jgi:tetratricopeptide (TPR) repeat protein